MVIAHPMQVQSVQTAADTVATARDVHVARLMAEVEQERRLRLKAEQRASGLKSANQRLQSTVLKLKAQVMDWASQAKDRG
jgi:hypothetical protein